MLIEDVHDAKTETLEVTVFVADDLLNPEEVREIIFLIRKDPNFNSYGTELFFKDSNSHYIAPTEVAMQLGLKENTYNKILIKVDEIRPRDL